MTTYYGTVKMPNRKLEKLKVNFVRDDQILSKGAALNTSIENLDQDSTSPHIQQVPPGIFLVIFLWSFSTSTADANLQSAPTSNTKVSPSGK